jgi:hypothetical protein
MNESLNWHGNEARFDSGMNRRTEQERRKVELMEHARTSSGGMPKRRQQLETDWAGCEVLKSQRRHVESKLQESRGVSELLSHKDLKPSSTSFTSGRKQFSDKYEKPLEIDLTGPGGRSKNNASSWKTSSQVHQSGMKTHVHRRTSKATVEHPPSVVSSRNHRQTYRPDAPKNTSTLFHNNIYDAIASRTSRFSSHSSKDEYSAFTNQEASRPLPGYTGKRRGIAKPQHHDKSVSVGYHPYGSNYSGRK